MWSSLAELFMQVTVDINKVTGDLSKPENQPNMPIMEKLLNQGYDKKNLPTYMIKSLKASCCVFQQFEDVLNDIELPEEAKLFELIV